MPAFRVVDSGEAWSNEQREWAANHNTWVPTLWI